MASTLITGISELWTLDPALDDPARPGGVCEEQILRDAALVIEEGTIAWTGPAAQAPSADAAEDLGGRAVLPGWVDSHSTWSSTGTVPRSSRPAWPAAPTRPAASA